MSATLHGTVAFQGAEENQNVILRFFTPNTDTEIFKACAPVVGGAFTIYGIPAGTYDVGIKSGGYMSVLKEDEVLSDGQTTQIDFGELEGGDITGNDRCQLADYNMALNNMGHDGDCHTYAGNWLLPECPPPPPSGGACYGYVIS